MPSFSQVKTSLVENDSRYSDVANQDVDILQMYITSW